MNEKESPKEIKKVIIRAILTVAIVSAVSAFVLYTNSYKRTLTYPDYVPDGVTVINNNSRYMAFIPKQTKCGLIFYPDTKTEYTAYEEMLLQCAEKGILCITVKSRFNLPMLNTEAAESIRLNFPDVDEWYVGGHADGGRAAVKCALRHQSSFRGIILFASYSKQVLYTTNLRVLTIRGSNDNILTKNAFDKYNVNLPSSAVKITIMGGNHSQFASYGEDKGDGKAEIPAYTQKEEAAKAVISFTSEI